MSQHRFFASAFIAAVFFFVPLASSLTALEEQSEYDFGDHTSVTLTSKAWGALAEKNENAVAAYTKKCIELYGQKASEQQASLTDFAPIDQAFDYWALNDVATCYFILGKSYKDQGKPEKAKEAFKKIVSDYSYAQCWDDKSKAHWKVAQAAQDQLSTLDSAYDFGDYTSEYLTTQAWKMLEKKDLEGVRVLTQKCVDLYSKEAEKMQQSLSEFPAKDKTFDYWALNDVGTCYFILGEAFAAKEKYPEAIEAYQVVVDNYSYAQCWDTQGWFWKPAVVSRGRINKIRAEQDL